MVFPNDIFWSHRISEKGRTLEIILVNTPILQMKKQKLREVPFLSQNHTWGGGWAEPAPRSSASRMEDAAAVHWQIQEQKTPQPPRVSSDLGVTEQERCAPKQLCVHRLQLSL